MGHTSSEPERFSADLGAAIFNATSDGALVLDGEGRVRQANRRAAQIFGADLIGAPASRIVPPAALAADHATVQLGLRSFRVGHVPLADQHALLLFQHLADAEQQQQGSHEQKLHDLLMAISSTLNIATILDRVARLSVELVDADAGSIPLYDADRDLIHFGWIINLPDTIRSVFPYGRSTGIVWDLIDSQRPILINNYPEQPHAIPILIDAGVTAVMAVPIVGFGRTIFGALAVYQLTPHKGFSHDDLDQLIVIGRQTGIAIQNARLYADILRDADQRYLLYLASVEIGAALESEALYAAIHRAAARLMTCDSFALALYDDERQSVEYVYIVDQQGRWPARRVAAGRGLLGHIIRNDIALRLNNCDPDIEAFFDAERMHASADHTRAILAVVMHTGQQIVGALTVQAHAPSAYSSKDLDILEMLASTAAIAIQNARLFARVQELATIDPLTQVPNRRHFFEVAARELERTDRYKRPVSLMIFDVDSFKAVNDTYGHLAGDQVLKTVAARCRDDLRDIDTVARFGGEEFITLLPETTYERAMQVAERLCMRVNERPIESDAGPIRVSVSIGVDSCDAMFAGTLSNLIDRADQALYVAKNSGRNRVVGFRSLIFSRHGSSQEPDAELTSEVG